MSQPDIHLYTAATMNGYKPVLFLEEADIPYDLTFIDFATKEQKAPAFWGDADPETFLKENAGRFAAHVPRA